MRLTFVQMETEIASLLGKNGKMPVSGIVEHLKGGKFPKATQKGVKTILQSNGETFTPEGDQWTLSKYGTDQSPLFWA